MNEYEHFKKWVNSVGVKIYYKLKPPTKKELYEITIRQEEEIERLKEENTILKQTMSNNSLLINENAFLKERIDKAIEYIYLHSTQRKWFADISDRLHNQEIQFKGRIQDLLDILKVDDKE